MVDIGLFGIDSGVITVYTEIAVAITTVILAFFTYQSVKISRITLKSLKDEVDIARKDFENNQIELDKPKILDQLKEVINPLFEQVNQELNQIDEKTLLWNTRKYNVDALFIRLKTSEEFFTDTDINTHIGIIIYEINSSFPNFKKLCQKRYKIYLSLSDLFRGIYNDIENPETEKKIQDLISDNNPLRPVYGDDGEFYYDTVPISDFSEIGLPPPIEYIPFDDFKKTLLDMFIANVLDQRVTPHNQYETMILSEYTLYEKKLKGLLITNAFENHSKRYHSLIEELREVDSQLKKEINHIKLRYREKYHLNDKEYWVIFKNTR